MESVVVARDPLEMASGAAAPQSRRWLASGVPTNAISLRPAIQRERAADHMLSLPEPSFDSIVTKIALCVRQRLESHLLADELTELFGGLHRLQAAIELDRCLDIAMPE